MNRESIVCVIACIIISWAHFIEGPINWHFSEPKLDWKKFYYRKHNLPKENYEDKEANFDFITMLKLSLSLSLSFLFCITANMGRCLLRRYRRLHELHGKAWSAGTISSAEGCSWWSQRIGTDQSLDREETRDWSLKQKT